MKKFIALFLALIMTVCILCGCNKQLVDFTYKFDNAIICLPNGDIIEGKVDSWKDYEDGDQIQVVIDGKTYLVHASNIVLMNN